MCFQTKEIFKKTLRRAIEIELQVEMIRNKV